MIIHLYAPCRDEAILLPYFFRHYDRFVTKYFIYDNNSTDGSVEKLKSNPKVEFFENNSDIIDERIYLNIKNEEWKKQSSEADWVICCDIDEFLYHKAILPLLEKYKADSVTIPRIAGFDMVGDKLPTTDLNIYDEIKEGIPSPLYNKKAIFDPKKVAPNYLPGCHQIDPEGYVIPSKTYEIALFHYRYLSLESTIEKYKRYRERISQFNVNHGFGYQYSDEIIKIEQEYLRLINKRENVFEKYMI